MVENSHLEVVTLVEETYLEVGWCWRILSKCTDCSSYYIIRVEEETDSEVGRVEEDPHVPEVKEVGHGGDFIGGRVDGGGSSSGDKERGGRSTSGIWKGVCDPQLKVGRAVEDPQVEVVSAVEDPHLEAGRVVHDLSDRQR